MKNTIVLILMVPCLFFSGCAAHHLRVTTTQHASTLTDIYETQILNNLARFIDNPHATPHFELPTSGGTDISGSVNLKAEPLNAFRTKFGMNGSRSGKTAWTLTPITDPDKLARMKCAFQRAVGFIPSACDDCCKTQEMIIKRSTIKFCDAPCTASSCWFVCSEHRSAAIKSGCPFGSYNGVFVWVPESGRADFSRLVFDILNYATKEPASAPSKQVTLFLDAKGNPTMHFLASQIVSANIELLDENKGVAVGSDISTKATQRSQFFSAPKEVDSISRTEREEAANEALDLPPVKSRLPIDLNRAIDLNQRFILDRR